MYKTFDPSNNSKKKEVRYLTFTGKKLCNCVIRFLNTSKPFLRTQ